MGESQLVPAVGASSSTAIANISLRDMMQRQGAKICPIAVSETFILSPNSGIDAAHMPHSNYSLRDRQGAGSEPVWDPGLAPLRPRLALAENPGFPYL